MKTRIHFLALLAGSVFLQACGGSMLGTSDSDDYKLIPEEVTEDPTAARPSANAPVVTTDGTGIFTSDGAPLLLRGVNLDFGADPLLYIDAIDAIKATGSNVVRVVLSADTHPSNLEAVLNKIAENNMFAELTLKDDALECNDDQAALEGAVSDLWLGEWRDVIALDHLQPHILLNVASGWGPDGVFNGYSTGYRTYIDNYKTIVRKFRKEGFNFPLVISAPGCGSDYWAFSSGRAKELMAADDKKNLIFSVHGYGNAWKDGEKTIKAIEEITQQDVPVVMSEFGGSGIGEIPVKHKEIIAKGAGDYYADLEVTWMDPTDKAGIVIPFDEPVDITNTAVSFDIRMDDAYIDDGQMGVQMYVRDANENYANMGWVRVDSLTKDKWNTLNYAIQDADSFGWASDGFDLTNVTKVGIELVANGKPVEVGGAIEVDNFKIAEGNGPVELFNQDFTDGIDGWSVPWSDATLAHDPSGALAVTRAGNEFDIQLTGLGEAKGFEPETPISLRVFVPASYAADASGMYFTIFNTEVAWTTTSYIGGDSFVFGDWAEITLTTPPAGDTAFPTSANTFGIQFGGLASSNEPILIDDVVIMGVGPASELVEGVQFESDFYTDTDGFAVLSWGNSGTVAVDGGNLTLAVNDPSSSRLTVTKQNWASEPLLDVTSDPFIIKSRIFIPESYSSLPEFRFQIFMQDSNWGSHFNAYELNADNPDLVFGDWIDIEFQVQWPEPTETDPDGFSPGTPQHFGFEFCADSSCSITTGIPFGTTEPVLMDYFIVEGLVPVEKEEVVYGLIDFHYLSHFENLTVDFVEGGLDQEELQATILGMGTRSDPFSWIAWSWFGNATEEMDWDMVTDATDADSLTERGEDIVNGKGGLKETGVLE